MFSSNTTQVSSGGYEIQRSLRFNGADSANLTRTPSTASNRKTWTWSGWVKRSTISAGQILFNAINGSDVVYLYFNPGDNLVFGGALASGSFNTFTTALYRDPSAWYHMVCVFDTTQAVATDRTQLYVNGQRLTLNNTPGFAQNSDGPVNSTVLHYLGTWSYGGSFFNGYMTEVNFIDGQALTPSSFGAFDAQTGVWGPTRYAGSYGTNGFYLNFSNNSNTTAATLGADYSGNGNNWTPNNFSVTAGAGNDSLVDVPTNWGVDTGVGGTVRGNYCTLNPLATTSANFTPTNGNLEGTTTSSTFFGYATFGVSSGKWYWEVVPTTAEGMIGIGRDGGIFDFRTANGYGYFSGNGQKYTNNTGASYGATYTTNDIIGVALDMDAGTLTFLKNGTSQGVAFSSLSGTFFASVQNPGNGTVSYTYNFGQRPFAYTAPSGFKALNTQNLPTPTIGATPATQAGKFFNPVLYTGNSTNRSITGVGFQPDFTWIKRRDPADSHYLFDSVRGATKYLSSDLTAAETTNTFSLTSFDSDGVSLGISSTVNSNTNPFVAWNWKANGAGVTNTAGSITSTVSANTTSGFSVVTFAAAASSTVGHGLGVAPSMVVVKSRTVGTAFWLTYHVSTGPTGFLAWNTTDAFATNATVWNNTAPTSTVFTIGSGFTNASYGNCVAYCFSEVPGYSKFGSYTGNGSADGPFVFCGFRPAYVMVKRSDNSYDWWIFDDTRSPNNAVNKYLAANSADAENTFDIMDFTANGFKIRNGSQGWNGSGGTIIFMAFAEAPQKFALAR